MLNRARRMKKMSLKRLSKATGGFLKTNTLRKLEKKEEKVTKAIKYILDPILDTNLVVETESSEEVELLEREVQNLSDFKCFVEENEGLVMATVFIKGQPFQTIIRMNQLHLDNEEGIKNDAVSVIYELRQIIERRLK